MRFSSYARRIRTLYLGTSLHGATVIPLEVFNLLSMQTPTLGHYPLPNLRSFYWKIGSWDLAPFLRLFLNPGLTSVHILFPTHDPHIYRPATISLIPTQDLMHLRLQRMGNEDIHWGELRNLLDEASETLRSVSLDGQPSMAVIDKLLRLPNLRSLDVQLPATRISPPAVVLPSLGKLVVRYNDPRSWLHILQNIPNPALREFDVTFTGSSTSYLQTLGSFLLNANVERTLVSLKCTSENLAPLTGAGIHPLLSFGRLTTLELSASCNEGQCGILLNDSIVSELAVALPHLTSLGLGSIPCKASTSNVTIASLVTLSMNCVDLDFLRLHFNANDITTRGIHANSRTRKFTCKLRTLSVGSQPLPSNHNDILLVTFTILHIFPHVETIASGGGGWRQVREGVQLFRKVPRIIPPTED